MLKIEHFALSLEKERLMVIEEISLSSGKKVLFFGNNETGKTLFLKSIHGDFSKFEGNILIEEKPLSFYKKKKQSFLLENTTHLLPDETVWKNIILPLPKVSGHIKKKIIELCFVAGLHKKIQSKVKDLSYSSQKFIELIRAVIQLPSIILIDDVDHFFDGKNLLKAFDVCEFAINSGSSIVATSKTKLENFDMYYRIQDRKVEKA